MTPPQPNDNRTATPPAWRVELPESIRQQFAALERRLWKIETAGAVSLSVSGLVLSLLALWVSDRLWDTPAWARVLLGAAGLGAALWATTLWVRRWVLRRRDTRALAILVQKRFRRIGDRLLGIVELADEKEHAYNASPALYRAAIQQVADEVAQCQFKEAVDTRPAKRFLAATAGLLLLLILVTLVLPEAMGNAFARWTAPWGSTPRLTLVRLESFPALCVVPHGEAFEVSGQVRCLTFWKARTVSARIGEHVRLRGTVTNGIVRFTVPGQVVSGPLRLQAGDARLAVAIQPEHRPGLKRLEATLEYPDYLRMPATNQTLASGTLTALEGSRVLLRGVVGRALASASMAQAGGAPQPLTVNASEFSSDSFPAAAQTLHLSWRDQLGLSNVPVYRLSMVAAKDQPPLPELPDLGRDLAMLHTEVLPVRLTARDDFGVADVGLTWDFVADEMPEGSITSEVRVQPPGSPPGPRFEKSFQWSPSVYRIPPDSNVELVGFARDALPGRERAETPAVRIQVLGKEKHAELVRQKLDAVLVQLEEVTRLEEKIESATAALEKAENLAPAEAGKRIESAHNDQQRNASHLDQVAREGARTLAEAMKNPLFSGQMIENWADTLKDMQKTAREGMKEAAADLKSAQKKAGEPAGRTQDLAEARQKEEKILDELEKMQQRVNRNLDDLQAMTLSQRLGKVSEAERNIEAELQKIATETIGLLPQELPDKLRRANNRSARSQEEQQAEAARLEKEISRFFERTQKTNYGAVSKEMAAFKTAEELDQLRGRIQENVLMESSRALLVWSERFQKWAAQIEPPKDDSDAGGEGGQGEKPTEDVTQQLIALLRLRQRQMGVQEQTRLLEDERKNEAAYAERTGALAEVQGRIAGELGAMSEANKHKELVRAYRETGGAMAEARALLAKPQTDAAVVQTEGRAIDALTDLINLINEQAKRQQPQPGKGEGDESESMAFLMQMMKQQAQMGQGMPALKPGGGNSTGGATDRPSPAAAGEVKGGAGENRAVSKAAGAGVSVPVEFRDALEQFYKAVEKEEAK